MDVETLADWQRYAAFTVSSRQFWHGIGARPGYKAAVVGFHSQLKRMGSSSFLVSHDKSVCDEASALHGIRCVLSRNFSSVSDPMMSMERWSIIDFYLSRGRPIVFAGADVRFTLPLQSFHAAVQSVQPIDAAFEGSAILYGQGGTVSTFTPDIIAAYPTARMRSFVRTVLAELRAPILNALPIELRQDSLLAYRNELTGPAQQDLLMDVLLSTLHGRPVALRRTALARQILDGISGGHRLARGPRIDGRSDLRRRKALGALEVVYTPTGHIIRSPRLDALLTMDRMTVAAYAPCAPRKCAKWDVRIVHALHCLGKHPRCLDLTQCQCPGVQAYWSSRADATVAEIFNRSALLTTAGDVKGV